MGGTVKDNLIAAKALIDTPEKWGQEDYEPRPGCFCLAGAIAKVKSLEPEPRTAEVGPEWDALCYALDELNDGLSPWPGPIHFNDAPGTTHADVMALFDRAIAAQDGTP